MDMKSQKQSVLVSVRHCEDALYVSTDKGNEWKFPQNISDRVAVASIIYGAMMNKLGEKSIFCSHYKVTMIIEDLDE